ncbi:glycosyltransferase family 4 protein [Halomonas huangheensis]|nr:glycosyltransferase family 4 protein [Halomonas huangheensis]ALM52819.1 glycosyl transferase family 1 [Halomonas huangheensis]
MIVWNDFLNDARVLKEAQTLQSAGHQVIVHALHAPGVTRQRERLESGVEVVRVARSPLSRMSQRKHTEGPVSRSAPQASSNSLYRQMMAIVGRSWAHLELTYQLVRSRPTVIHAHDVNVLPTAWLAAVLARVPLVYDAHEISTDREGYKSFRRVVGWVEKKLMPRAVGTITTTDARAKFFARAYGIPRPLVLQNRPRLTQVEQSTRIRDELKLDQPWPIILYQGGLQQGRGLPRLVEVAARVPSAYFVFIGGGRQEGELQRLAEQLALSERVRFIPTVALSELPYYTASADIGVQPIENTCLNHFTTDSNKLFEYVVAGLPVVASSLPEISKVVRRHDLGILTTPGNSESLAEALNTLVQDPALRKRYAQNAGIASQHLNWEEQEQALVKLYERVLAG